MRSARAAFGPASFRRFPRWATRRGPINRALFESWSVVLADFEPDRLRPHAGKIQIATRTMMEDYKYSAAITQGTGDYSKVKLRFDAAREILREALQ